MSELTRHLVRKIEKDKFQLTREDLVTTLGIAPHNHFILIAVESRDRIIAIPLNDEPIVKLVAKTVSNYAATAFELSRILKEANLEHFYTTGVCPKGTHCVHESYLKPQNNNQPLTQTTITALQKQLQQVKGIIHVELTLIWEPEGK